MSPSLFLVAWMGLVASVLAQRSQTAIEFLVASAAILAAAAAAFVEAGSLETGIGSGLRRPLQMAACLLFFCYVILTAGREMGLWPGPS